MAFDLERFVQAQEGTVRGRPARAPRRAEDRALDLVHLPADRRASGRSDVAHYYALESLAEARAYLAHPVLGPRLARLRVGPPVGAADRTAEQILGGLDAVKVRSSMTLFHRAAPDEPMFRQVLDRFYGGVEDELTIARLG